ncbi:MAG: toll/interleukin-1 receptor domain-containing protein [Gammaproteobacteria bacterium]
MADYVTEEDLDVFVAYARKDQSRVEKIVRFLEAKGFSVFWDLDIRAGEDWHAMLLEKLDQARCVLVVWSKISEKSEAVLEEAREANKCKKYFPVVLEDLNEPPIYYRSKQFLKLGGTEVDSRNADMEKLAAGIRDFIDRRNSKPERNLDPTDQPNDLESLLIKTVNRASQLGAIRAKLNEDDSAVSMFLYSGTPADWPAALANHLQYNRAGESEAHSLILEAGDRRDAFKNALLRTLLPGVHADEGALLNWFKSGQPLKILLCELLPDDLGWEFRKQVLGAAEFLSKVKPHITEHQVVVLFACTCNKSPSKFTHWWRSKVYTSRKAIPFSMLKNLGAITGVHADHWVSQVERHPGLSYDFAKMKEFFVSHFETNSQERYMKLKPFFERALIENRR